MKNIVVNTFLVVLFIILTAGIFLQVAASGAVCPQGDVKYEVGEGYEYSNNSATVTIFNGDKNWVEWTAQSGYEIISVCIKIGGPGGGSLKNGLVDGGGPFAYDISHIVISTKPTSTPNPSPSPNPSPTPTPNHEKIIICHATGSEHNHYVEIEVDRNAWDQHSSGHSQHLQDFAKGDRVSCSSQGSPNPSPSPSPTPTPGTNQTLNNQSSSNSSSSTTSSQSGEVLAAVTTLPETGADLPFQIAVEVVILTVGLVLRKLAK